MDPIHVVFGSNEGYAAPLSVALRSLYESAADPRRIEVSILDDGITEESKALIRASTDLAVEFITPPEIERPDLGYFTRAAYLRFFIPSLFQDRRWSLYLDCDLVVLDDVARLWEQRDEKLPLGAIADNGDEVSFDFVRARGWGTKDQPYFNSGVLLMNLEHLRSEDLLGEGLTFCARHEPPNPDQDYLNLRFEGRCRLLDRRWNQAALLLATHGEPTTRPGIAHFLWIFKPWHLDGHRLQFHREWLEFASRTPWPKARLFDVSQTVRRIVRRVKKGFSVAGHFDPASAAERIALAITQPFDPARSDADALADVRANPDFERLQEVLGMTFEAIDTSPAGIGRPEFARALREGIAAGLR